jgi:hypothetical protein
VRSLLVIGLGFTVIGCASLPPQVRPATLQPFVGAWKGAEYWGGNPTHNILVLLDPVEDGKVEATIVRLHGLFDHFHFFEDPETLSLHDGELVGWGIVLRLHGPDRLAGEGTKQPYSWSLSRLDRQAVERRLEAFRREKEEERDKAQRRAVPARCPLCP